MPKNQRGRGLVCKGINGSYSYDHNRHEWVPSYVLDVLRAKKTCRNSEQLPLSDDYFEQLDDLLVEDDYQHYDLPFDEVLMRLGLTDASS